MTKNAERYELQRSPLRAAGFSQLLFERVCNVKCSDTGLDCSIDEAVVTESAKEPKV